MLRIGAAKTNARTQIIPTIIRILRFLMFRLCMVKLRVLSFGVSLDGYGAGSLFPQKEQVVGYVLSQVCIVVGPVGFEPTTSAESLVYGYLHALPNFLIPRYWSVCMLS